MLTRAEFIQTYMPVMIAATKDTGIFPSVMMAQAIVESQAPVNGIYYPGQNVLAKKYNNYFGIKADASWKGEKVYLQDGDGGSYYRVYPSMMASFVNYVKFLKSNPRYTTAGVFTANTPEQQADRLQAAGYATNPNYSKLLKAVMNTIPGNTVNYAGTGAMAAIAILLLLLVRNG